MEDKRALTTCQKCNRQTPLEKSKCIYCGNAVTGAVLVPPSKPATVGTRPKSPAPTDKPTKLDLPINRPEKNLCPNCSSPKPRQPIAVETWEYKRYSFWGRRKYFDVRSAKVPGYCAACSKMIERKRAIASVLMAVPLWVFFLVGVFGGAPASAVLTVLYIGWMIRWFSYSAVDMSIYGANIETDLEHEIQPLRPERASVRFPISPQQGLFRFFIIPAGPIVATAFFLLIVGGVRMGGGLQPSTASPAFEELRLALTADDSSKAITLLRKNKDLALETNNTGETPLFFAVTTDDAQLINTLVDYGVNVHARDKSNGFTALHKAAAGGFWQAANELIRHQANVDELSNAGETPLVLAVISNKPKSVKALLKAGANANAKVKSGQSVLAYAKAKSFVEIESILRDANARE